MPDYRRARVQGGTFFFTVVTYQRQTILLDEPVRQALRFAMNETRRILPFQVDAWVLLPDHLHCVWTLPDGDGNYSLRWSLIKQSVSRRCAEAYREKVKLSHSHEKRRESTLWQRRFWEHQIRDDQDFERHVDYIHWNPVKHGIVTKAAAWPYSTFHRYVRAGVYPADWGTAEDFDGTEFGECFVQRVTSGARTHPTALVFVAFVGCIYAPFSVAPNVERFGSSAVSTLNLCMKALALSRSA